MQRLLSRFALNILHGGGTTRRVVRSAALVWSCLLFVVLVFSNGGTRLRAAAQPVDAATAAYATATEAAHAQASLANLMDTNYVFAVWSSEFSSDPAALTQNMYRVESNLNPPPPLELTETARLMDAGATDGVHDNRHLAAASGNFGGDGLEDVAYAWEGADRRPYIAVPTLDAQTLDWNVAQTVLLSPVADGAPQLSDNTSPRARLISLVADNFDADPASELVLAYHAETNPGSDADQVQLVLYDRAAGSNTWQAVSLLSDQVVAADRLIFDLTSGDLDGNGDNELVLAAFTPGAAESNILVVYDVENLSLSRSLSTSINLPAGAGSNAGNLAVTTGNFDSNGSDDEVAVTFAYLRDDVEISGTPDNVYLFFLRANNALTALTQDVAPALSDRNLNENNIPPTDLASGDMNGDGRDELGVLIDATITVYEFTPASGTAFPFALNSVGTVGYDYPADIGPIYSRDIIALEDVTNDMLADVVWLGITIGGDNPNWEQEIVVEVWLPDVCLTGPGCSAPGAIAGFLPGASLSDELVISNNLRGRSFALAVGNDDFTLGAVDYTVYLPLVVR